MRFRILPALAVAMAAITPPAFAKLCPPGRFALTGADALGDAPMVLVLDEAGASLEGTCPPTRMRPGSYFGGVRLRFRARWDACEPLRSVKLRARFDPPCDALVGMLRSRGTDRLRITGTRIPECGNGYVESGESCDDGNADDGDCCTGDCQAESGCFIGCQRTADCNPIALCMRPPAQCGGLGLCLPIVLGSPYGWPAGYDPCADGPQCGCDAITYASSCDAWAAGTATWYAGPCS